MPTLRLDGDAKKGVKAFADLEKAIGKTEDKLELTTREAKKLETQAKRIVDSNLGPQERYNRKMAELATHVKAGTLNMQQAEAQALKLGDRLATAERRGRGAFDPSLLLNYAKGFATPLAACTTLLSMLRDIRAEQSQVAQNQVALLPGRAKLAQLAGGDASELSQLHSTADNIYASGFVENRDQAYSLAYELGSSNQLRQQQFFSQLALVGDSPNLAKSTGLIRSGFRGGDDVGTARELVSKAFAAAKPATGVSASDVAGGVALSAAGSKTFGFTDEESFAAISLLSQVTGSGSQAGTQFRAFNTALIRRGLADELQGQGLGAVVDLVEAQGLNKEQLEKYFGSSEAASAFDVLRNDSALQSRISAIESAQRDDLAGKVIRSALTDGVNVGAVWRRRGDALRELSLEQQAVATNLSEGQQGINTAADREWASESLVWTTNRTRDAIQWTYGPYGGEDAMRTLIEETRNQTRAIESQQLPRSTRQE